MEEYKCKDQDGVVQDTCAVMHHCYCRRTMLGVAQLVLDDNVELRRSKRPRQTGHIGTERPLQSHKRIDDKDPNSMELLLFHGLDNVEWIGSSRIGGNIHGRRRLKKATVMKKASRNKNMFQITGLQPNGKGLCGKTPIAHAQNTLSARFEDTSNFLKNFQGLCQVIDRHDARDHVKGIVLHGYSGILIQVLDNVVRQDGVLPQFVGIHAQSNHLVATRPVGRIMTHPRGTQIQDVLSVLKATRVVLGQGGHCGLLLFET